MSRSSGSIVSIIAIAADRLPAVPEQERHEQRTAVDRPLSDYEALVRYLSRPPSPPPSRRGSNALLFLAGFIAGALAVACSLPMLASAAAVLLGK